MTVFNMVYWESLWSRVAALAFWTLMGFAAAHQPEADYWSFDLEFPSWNCWSFQATHRHNDHTKIETQAPIRDWRGFLTVEVHHFHVTVILSNLMFIPAKNKRPSILRYLSEYNPPEQSYRWVCLTISLHSVLLRFFFNIGLNALLLITCLWVFCILYIVFFPPRNLVRFSWCLSVLDINFSS